MRGGVEWAKACWGSLCRGPERAAIRTRPLCHDRESPGVPAAPTLLPHCGNADKCLAILNSKAHAATGPHCK